MTGIRKYWRKIKKILNKRVFIFRFGRGKNFDIRLLTACVIEEDFLRELLERGVRFAHPVGVVISTYAKIGGGTKIWQNVTIGAKRDGIPEDEILAGNCYPVIGRNVMIYAGAVIMGGVTIGNHCIVAANAVVNRSFPPYSVIAGVPARKIGTVPALSDEASREENDCVLGSDYCM